VAGGAAFGVVKAYRTRRRDHLDHRLPGLFTRLDEKTATTSARQISTPVFQSNAADFRQPESGHHGAKVAADRARTCLTPTPSGNSWKPSARALSRPRAKTPPNPPTTSRNVRDLGSAGWRRTGLGWNRRPRQCQLTSQPSPPKRFNSSGPSFFKPTTIGPSERGFDCGIIARLQKL